MNFSSTFRNSLMFLVVTGVLSSLDNVDSSHWMAQTAVFSSITLGTSISDIEQTFPLQSLSKLTIGTGDPVFGLFSVQF